MGGEEMPLDAALAVAGSTDLCSFCSQSVQARTHADGVASAFLILVSSQWFELMQLDDNAIDGSVMVDGWTVLQVGVSTGFTGLALWAFSPDIDRAYLPGIPANASRTAPSRAGPRFRRLKPARTHARMLFGSAI